ncbi:hypothetical protein ZIOFF_041084 [Zingiber officinale]|uniref:AMP-activated protein kinase glycogen-binding domain-containing protein n=1 Tax=Zingiber officinale TaxID=94328 RepID=A0A8J5GB10_ZINOF|nr:hypothetical protein ZIOFF_041084 [Zingiber officinale]
MECLKTNLMRKLDLAQDYTYPCIEPSGRLWMRRRRLTYSHSSYTSSQDFPRYFSMIYPSQSFLYGHKSSRTFAIPINVGVEPSSLSEEKNTNGANEIMLEDTSEVGSPRKLTSDELLVEEDALTKYKNELAVLELELQASIHLVYISYQIIKQLIQALVGLAEEVANSGIPLDSRKINGKYIQSHLLARLEVVHEKVKEQIKDVDLLRFEEVELFWVGMAESVQVKGSFDGWTKGEEMSPEYSGNCARFSATLKLRPGRYEIKFLVDGEWQLSTELPTVGEGLMQNNLLVVTS